MLTPVNGKEKASTLFKFQQTYRFFTSPAIVFLPQKNRVRVQFSAARCGTNFPIFQKLFILIGHGNRLINIIKTFD